MTSALCTFSEMTKGYDCGPLQDNPLKPIPFPCYQLGY